MSRKPTAAAFHPASNHMLSALNQHSSSEALTGRVSSPGGRSKKVTFAFLLVTFLLLVLACFAHTNVAYAAVVHNFEPAPTEAISKSAETCGTVTGPLGEVNALTVSLEKPGEASLWLAEQKETGVGERVDEFNAETGAGCSQIPRPSLEHLFLPDFGVAVGHVTGEREVYVGAYEDRTSHAHAVVGVFGPAGTLQAVWTGANTPNGSFADSGGRRREPT